MIGIAVWFLVLMLVAIWLRFSFWQVKPGERAIIVIVGVPHSVHGPGFIFLPKWFGNRLIRIPSKQFKVGVQGTQVYSATNSDCPRELLTIAMTFYLTFPSGSGLINVNRAGIPTKEEDLLTYFGPVLRGAAQEVLSRRTWREAVNEMAVIGTEIYNSVTVPGMTLGDFLSWGGRFRLVVEGIDLPASLKAAISYVNQAQVTSQAASNIVQRRIDLSVGAVLERMSRATGLTVGKLQKEIKNDPELKKQFQKLSLDMAGKEGTIDGQFFDGQKITTIHVHGSEKSLSGFAGALKGSSGKQDQSKGKQRKEVIGGVVEEVDD